MRSRPAARRLLGLATVVLPLVLAGCTMLTPYLLPQRRIEGGIPAPALLPAGTPPKLQVGAARVDLTPIPGIPMAYSLDGKVSRGFWTRLYARAIYLQDKNGQAIVLVSCDLPHIPNGFGDRVAELVSETPGIEHLGRAQIILAATHSHHSPENFFSDKYYNSLPSPRAGFDPELFQFLAERVTTAILEAFDARESAKLRYKDAKLNLFFRNRSLPAFLRNADAEAFLSTNSTISGSCSLVEGLTDGRACKAVRSVVEAIEFVRADDTPIASAVFLAAHPTVLSPASEVYSGDLFGVAATLLEQRRLGECASYASPIVALFNGAQGDASVAWERRDRFELLNTDTTLGRIGLAVELARFICQQLSPATPEPDPTIALQFAWLPLKESLHARTMDADSCQPWNERCIVEESISGAAAMGGAQDGRTIWYEIGTRDGLRSSARGPHGRKAVGIESGADPIEVSEMLTGGGTPPTEIPLGVYRVGNIVFATLPGEFTTMLGERIRTDIGAALPGSHVVLIGLANGRVSYVTTSEEYDAQFYEGGQNLYGAATGPLIRSKLGALAEDLASGKANDPDVRSYDYKPGICRVFLPRDAGFPAYHADDGLQNILQDLAAPKVTKRDFKMQCWIDAIPRLPRASNECKRSVPYVWIEPKNTTDPGAQCTGMSTQEAFLERPCDRSLAKQCDPAEDPRRCIDGVPQDNCGLDVVTVLHGSYLDRTRWCAFWMPSQPLDPKDHVLCAVGVTGENILQAGGMIDEAAGMLSYPDELIGPAGSPKTIDAGPDTWFGRLVARHAECCGLPTRPVCKYPSSGP